ncbi:MAG TPA: alanine/glycine:cation symporter family protein, partial [Luteolibacter sp.]|nr:alanine/glycine:cation symporter family protein [Luteolibacter sp.]
MFARLAWLRWMGLLLIGCATLSLAPAQDAVPVTAAAAVQERTLDQKIDDFFKPITELASEAVFAPVYGTSSIVKGGIPFILVWLAGGALFLTLYFRFVNLSSFLLALRTVRGKYSKADDPGEITHFQALSSAVSGTVGLGNIAGVAIAINTGGPGACLWMLLLGLFGMSSKFAECTLGVKYRHIDHHGRVHGGPMHYLTRGLADRGFGPLGKTLAVIFALLCIGGAFGGGNMFQVNQAVSQFVNVTGGPDSFIGENRWLAGLAVAVIVGLVIIGGISRIGQVTEKLVPFMTILYVLGCLVVFFVHWDRIGETFRLIFTEAFNLQAAGGGVIGAMLIGIRRAAFSNEAGVGSAPIAHAAAKTHFPASEGVVALLEPFVDTVVICTMTALVVICTGDYLDTGKDGITMTSESFSSVMPWFKYVLSLAVILFALSTLITWSYYGLQAWKFLFGKSHAADLIFKTLFCLGVIAGASMNMENVVGFSDAMLLAM